MSPLARKLYRHLKKRILGGHSSITYRQLASSLGDLHPRSPAFHTALGEVANACRHAKLPVLPAIVWKSGTDRPSTGYYKVAHPRAHTDEARRAAWLREHAKVIAEAERFPASLD